MSFSLGSVAVLLIIAGMTCFVCAAYAPGNVLIYSGLLLAGWHAWISSVRKS